MSKEQKGRPPVRRRGVVAAACGSAAAVAVTAVAWACTPIVDEVPLVHNIIHDAPEGSSAASLLLNLEVLENIPSAPDWTYNVLQDDDGIQQGGFVRPRQAALREGGGSCGIDDSQYMLAPDPVVGSMTYVAGKGTGTATVTPLNGPGVYEICTGPFNLQIKGYVTFW